MVGICLWLRSFPKLFVGKYLRTKSSKINVPEPYYGEVFEKARQISRAIQNVTACKRVGTIIAGWDVPHFHYHLVPMFDYADLDPKHAKVRTREENISMQSAIICEIEQLNATL